MSNNKRLAVDVFNDGVAQLASSSRDLAARFGQRRTVDGQIALIREELAEVLSATDDAHRVEELCDLVVVWHGLSDVVSGTDNGKFFICIGRLPERARLTATLAEMENAIETWITSQFSSRFVRVLIWIDAYLQTIPNAAELFPAAVAAVVAKNAAKTTDTHYLDSATGKITRKAVMPEPEDNINADLENGAAVDGWLDGGV